MTIHNYRDKNFTIGLKFKCKVGGVTVCVLTVHEIAIEITMLDEDFIKLFYEASSPKVNSLVKEC